MNEYAELCIIGASVISVPFVTNLAAYFSIGSDIMDGIPKSKIKDNYFGASRTERIISRAFCGIGYYYSMQQCPSDTDHEHAARFG